MKGSQFVILILTFLVTVGSSYQLKKDVVSSGGTIMTSSDYVVKGTLSQMTASNPWVTNSEYKAIIGFWHPDYTVSVKEKISPFEIPFKNFLCQNLPNPAFRSTTIHYSLAQKGFVSLEVFNAIGQRVITLVDEEQEPGLYKVVWNVQSASRTYVPAGVYFYRLQTKDYKKIRKIVILR